MLRPRTFRVCAALVASLAVPACGFSADGGAGTPTPPPPPLLVRGWTWMAGSSTPGAPDVHGTRGVTQTGNTPGGRQMSVGWVGASGHFWLFGGVRTQNGPGDYFNDLWRWDGAAWTWISGASAPQQFGTYGAKGVVAPTNQPGSRYASSVWTDAAGHAWVFGGIGYSANAGSQYLNDLWRWDGAAWTWTAGSDQIAQVGTYGTRGVAHPSNTPGGRVSAATWFDGQGTAWLYGGSGYGTSNSGNGGLSDLWRWDGSAWTWVSGGGALNVAPVYGTRGVANSANTPGGRQNPVSWRDAAGRLWLFGGIRVVPPGLAVTMNDLWRWDGSAWTWMAGSDGTNPAGVYGVQGVADPANSPGGRWHASGWVGADGAFWLFGGSGQNASGAFAMLNDLWRWDGAAWTWVDGSSAGLQAGVYGSLGVQDPSARPGSHGNMTSFAGVDGTLWFWGGFGYGSSGSGNMNDLWRYTP